MNNIYTAKKALTSACKPIKPAQDALLVFEMNTNPIDHLIERTEYHFWNLIHFYSNNVIYKPVIYDNIELIVKSLCTGKPCEKYITLETGLGKTTLALALTVALSNFAQEYSLLIAFYRIEEIASFLERLNKYTDNNRKIIANMGNIGHLHSKDDSEAGFMSIGEDRKIVLITHRRLQDSHDQKWKKYNNNKRDLIIFDEEFLPVEPYSFNLKKQNGLTGESHNYDFNEGLAQFCEDLNSADNGEVINLPDLSNKHFYSDTVLDKLKLLCKYRDSACVKEYSNSKFLVDALPIYDEYDKIVVLDATAHLNPFIITSHKPLKRYDNVSVYHRYKGAGKTSTYKDCKNCSDSFSERVYSRFVKDILDVLYRKRDKKILIVTFKELIYQKKIKDAILNDPNLKGKVDLNKVKFTTWGKHRSDNDYKDCEVVILYGIMHRPYQIIDAYNYGITGNFLSNSELRNYQKDWAFADIIQAVSRGNLRNIDRNLQAGEMEIYLYHYDSEFERMIKEAFPNINYHQWVEDNNSQLSTVAKQNRSTKQDKCYEAIKDVLAKAKEDKLTRFKKTVKEKLGNEFSERAYKNVKDKAVEHAGWYWDKRTVFRK